MTDSNRRQAVIALLIIFAVSSLGLCAYQYFRYGAYARLDAAKISLCAPADYWWHIDRAQDPRISKLYTYEIRGWIVRKDENIDTRSIKLIIANDDGSFYLVPTKMTDRKDVTKAKNSEGEKYDYDKSGFAVAVNKSYVQSPNSKIYVLYGNNGRNEIVDIDETFGGEKR